MASDQGLVVRLPKLLDDPAWEVMAVPATLRQADFLAALQLWRWQRHMAGRSTGDRPGLALAERPFAAAPTRHVG